MWTITWFLVFVAPNGYRAAPEFEMEKPVFESKMKCEEFVLTYRNMMVKRIAREFELPDGIEVKAEAVCNYTKAPV